MSDIFSKAISEADTSDTTCCALLTCATTLASMGMDVIPSEDKWDYKLHWAKPSCGDTIMYYIVEFRYAVFDTSLSLRILNNIAGAGFRVYGVNHEMTGMSMPSVATYTDTLFYGVEFGTSYVEIICPE